MVEPYLSFLVSVSKFVRISYIINQFSLIEFLNPFYYFREFLPENRS